MKVMICWSEYSILVCLKLFRHSFNVGPRSRERTCQTNFVQVFVCCFPLALRTVLQCEYSYNFSFTVLLCRTVSHSFIPTLPPDICDDILNVPVQHAFALCTQRVRLESSCVLTGLPLLLFSCVGWHSTEI